MDKTEAGYVFLSYCTKNSEFAESVRRKFLDDGMQVWMAPYDIPAGGNYAQTINEAIKKCSCFVLLLSVASQGSEHVDREVERAVSYRKWIIPVKIENLIMKSSFEYYFANCQIYTLTEVNVESQRFGEVIKKVKAVLSPDTSLHAPSLGIKPSFSNSEAEVEKLVSEAEDDIECGDFESAAYAIDRITKNEEVFPRDSWASNPRIFFCKLMIEFECEDTDGIVKHGEDVLKSPSFRKALMLAGRIDENLEKKYLSIKNRIESDIAEKVRLEDEEKKAVERMMMISLGTVIELGEYPQKALSQKETVKWRVIAKADGKLLLISEKCLDVCAYNTQGSASTWHESTVREWLNGKFFDEAFGDEDKKRIVRSTVVNTSMQGGVNAGGDTEDFVFLLSTDEAKKYFASEGARSAQSSEYAMGKGVNVTADRSWWWLRSPGMSSYRAARVGSDGTVRASGEFTDAKSGGVRPALWIKL